MDPDEQLVVAAAAGSREAFDELVSRHRRGILKHVRILVPDRGGPSDAEDLVQDTFVRAYRAVASFRFQSTFRSWLHRIADNVVRSHYERGHAGSAWKLVSLDHPHAIDALIYEDRIEEAVLRRDTINAALAALPHDVRLLLVLRGVHELTYEEIARSARIPRGTVESRIFRARRRLRPLLRPSKRGEL